MEFNIEKYEKLNASSEANKEYNNQVIAILKQKILGEAPKPKLPTTKFKEEPITVMNVIQYEKGSLV